MSDEAKEAVKEKIAGVEKEQGSFSDVNEESPPAFGHDSATSEGVAGDLMPGGKGFPGPTGKA